MPKPERRKLERVQYWQGQMLKSRDFRDIQAVAAQRRWWHNRALHNAYGIYKGFVISLPSNSSAVEVRPGVAYDCFGRELILQVKQTISLPVLPPEDESVQFLLARYPAPQGSCADESSGACWGQQNRSRLETIELFWKPKQSVTLMDGVLLGRVLHTNKTFRLVPDLVRPAIQPLASALVVSGATVPGNTAWDLWTAGDINATANLPNIIGVQTTIDTSAAGFTDIPVYFAQLEGPLWSPPTRQLVPALLASVVDEAVNSFTFQVWLPAPRFRAVVVHPQGPSSGSPPAAAAPAPTTQLVDASTFALFAQQQGLYVSWVGCQCLSSCRPLVKAVAFVEQTLKP